MFPIFIAPLIFSAFFLFFLSMILLFGGSFVKREEGGLEKSRPSNLIEQFRPFLQSVINFNKKYNISPNWLKKNKLYWDIQLRKAGLHNDISSEEFLALKQMIPLVTFVLLMIVGIVEHYPLLAFLIAIFTFFLPDLKVKEVIKKRGVQIQRNLTEALDNIVLIMGAGMDFVSALNVYLSGALKNPLSEELALAMQDIKLGKMFSEALVSMAKKADHPALSNLSAVIVQTQRTGAPLSEVLRAQADDLRRRRFQLAEELGQKAPLKMLAPLLLLIFPNVFIILFAPIALNFFYR